MFVKKTVINLVRKQTNCMEYAKISVSFTYILA